MHLCTHIFYMELNCMPTQHTNLNKLITLHNQLVRILQSKPRTRHTRQLYLNYNVLPIPELHKQQLIIFVYKYLYHSDLLPRAFLNNDYFAVNNIIHNYNTRRHTNVHIFGVNTTHGRRSTRYRAAVLWNDLPEQLHTIPGIFQFKKSLKCHLLSLLSE